MWKWSLSIKQIKMITLCKLSRQKSYKYTYRKIYRFSNSFNLNYKQTKEFNRIVIEKPTYYHFLQITYSWRNLIEKKIKQKKLNKTCVCKWFEFNEDDTN